MKRERGTRESVINKGLWILALVAFAAGVSGCSGRNRITFHVSSEKDMNLGRPLYLVICETNKKDFLTAEYDKIADLVCSRAHKDQYVCWQMLLPGESKTIKIRKPETAEIGIYGMFINPDDDWKLILTPPFDKEYDIAVSQNMLTNMTENERGRDSSGGP